MAEPNQFTLGIEIGGLVAEALRKGARHEDLIAALQNCITLCRLDAELTSKRNDRERGRP